MNKIGFVARGKIVRAKMEERRQQCLDNAPQRAQIYALKARDDAFTVVVVARENIAVAEAAVAKWTTYLANYKEVTGVRAIPRELNDINARIDVASETLARHRHELADAEAHLAVAEAALQVAINPAPAPAEKPKKAS